MKKYVINVSDSFVHPVQKMKKEIGKIGHGERRLYVGNDNSVTTLLASKPWVFDFSQFCEPRDEIRNVKLVKQDGKEDTRRFYLGVKNTTSENVKLFDEVRKSVLPQKTCFVVEEKDDVFHATVLEAEKVDRTAGQKGGYSKIAVRWLDHEAGINNIKIKHAENGGEFCFRTKKGYKWPVDGFCEDTKTVYEFYGDYYHGNPAKFSGTDLYHGVPYSQKWEKDELKRKTFEELGYKVVVMWESDWIQHEKVMKLIALDETM